MTDSLLVPAEWASHRAIWTAWPYLTNEWPHLLKEARKEAAAMIRALADGDLVKVLVCGAEAEESAKNLLSGSKAEIIQFNYGDIWLRDSGPVFAKANGKAVANVFGFNAWGGKFDLPHDKELAENIAKQTDAKIQKHAFILEGGSVDFDGIGTALTTGQCLLNPNRNKGWDKAKAEAALRVSYGAQKTIWLGDGLVNDHTDGHIDNIARFVAPGRVVCQSPNGNDDPNADTLRIIEKTLKEATDADGKKFDVITIPSPGFVGNADGEALAASHMNFLIGNKTVVVPIYNHRGDAAVEALAKLFPTRKVIGLHSNAIVTEGGGSFHCMTQQEPA